MLRVSLAFPTCFQFMASISVVVGHVRTLHVCAAHTPVCAYTRTRLLDTGFCAITPPGLSVLLSVVISSCKPLVRGPLEDDF